MKQSGIGGPASYFDEYADKDSKDVDKGKIRTSLKKTKSICDDSGLRLRKNEKATIVSVSANIENTADTKKNGSTNASNSNTGGSKKRRRKRGRRKKGNQNNNNMENKKNIASNENENENRMNNVSEIGTQDLINDETGEQEIRNEFENEEISNSNINNNRLKQLREEKTKEIIEYRKKKAKQAEKAKVESKGENILTDGKNVLNVDKVAQDIVEQVTQTIEKKEIEYGFGQKYDGLNHYQVKITLLRCLCVIILFSLFAHFGKDYILDPLLGRGIVAQNRRKAQRDAFVREKICPQGAVDCHVDWSNLNL